MRPGLLSALIPPSGVRGLLCLVLGVALGFFIEHRLDKPITVDCEVIDYGKVEQLVARQVKMQSVQPFDVSKIKHVKSFTYAPVICACDSLTKH